MPLPTRVASNIAARNVRPLLNFDSEEYQALSRLGVHISASDVADMQRHQSRYIDATGMDSLEVGLSTPSIATPVQFLQNWLPGFVEVITQVRMIDELIGISTVGSWEDEEIVQGYLEQTGRAVPYGDYTNVPLSSWNSNYETRTVVRFEQGASIGQLEAARAAKVKIDSASEKRAAATLQLEVQRNAIGFFGYNNGSNYTFGFLNEPNLAAYVIVANGATSGTPGWATKSYLDIVADLRTAYASLRVASGDNIKPDKTAITLAIATASVDYLSVVSQYGNSVWDWIKENYPNTRVLSAPELDAAHAGDNVFYMYAESVTDTISTDDKNVWMQAVPAKFKVLGIENRAKMYVEDYTNATAGSLLKRPYAVVRYYGI